MSASKLHGDDVVNNNGESLGKIKEILRDSGNGKAAYAVLSYSSFLGMGKKHFAVPWNSLKLDPEHKGYVLNLAKDQLKNMPQFSISKSDSKRKTSSGSRAFIASKRLTRRMMFESLPDDMLP